MRPARAFALGLLHGPAELLPVSSSAHAGLLLQDLEPERRKELEVALHAGTLAVLGLPRPRAWLVAATLPPALAGFLLERPIEQRLGTPRTHRGRPGRRRPRDGRSPTHLGRGQAPARSSRGARPRRRRRGVARWHRAGLRAGARRVAARGRADRAAGARLLARATRTRCRGRRRGRCCSARRCSRAFARAAAGASARSRRPPPGRRSRPSPPGRRWPGAASGRRCGRSRSTAPPWPLASGAMAEADAYAAAGVDIDESDRAVSALVGVLKGIEVPSRAVDLPGHYASVLRLTDELGIAFATDGVGSKLIVAEETGRIDTVGIDCVAMNVNDIICVGAEPIALVDYIAVEQADPDSSPQIAKGLAVGAQAADVRDPRRRGRGAARAHPRPPEPARLRPVRVGASAPCSSTRSSPATRSRPGDALIGLPSSGPALQRLHARPQRAAQRSTTTTRRPSSAARRVADVAARADGRSTCARCSSCCARTSPSTASRTSPAAAPTTSTACATT